jgi:hypothetical protein
MSDKMTTGLFAAGGPALLGGALGITEGWGAFASHAITLPAVVGASTVLTLPALYIGAALFRIAPPAGEVATAARRALGDFGRVAAGLSPALLFLGSTTSDPRTASMLGAVCFLVASVFALRTLYLELFELSTPRPQALALYLSWSLIPLGIGAKLLGSIS